MLKILISFTLILSFLDASVKDINNKIKNNEKQFENVASKKENINKSISSLAQTINKEEKEYADIVAILETTNTELLLNRIKLTNAITKINKLKKESIRLANLKEKIEKNVIDFVIERYAMSMGIEQVKKESLEDVVGKEVYTLVFDNTRQEILDLNINYLKINNNIRDNEKRINSINLYITKQKAIKEKYLSLELAQEKTLLSLKQQHKKYQINLQKVIEKQNKITDLLGNLNILKKKEIKKEEDRIKRAKALAQQKALEKKKKEAAAQRAKELAAKKAVESEKALKTKKIKIKDRKALDEEIDIEVKKIGSSAKGIQISKYRGRKTIAPLKSYEIVKKFGKYYDEVYKMELFNESVGLKTKTPNAKVFSVFKGQVVYAKENSGLLAKVVIVKHQNNLHTIYSHLDKISPTLKVGKWIPKGYVVGRVSDTLEFQATKNSKYVDPMKLVK